MFVLDAKKMGHSIYSFARKGELFNKMNNNINNINNINPKLTRMIINYKKNWTTFFIFRIII